MSAAAVVAVLDGLASAGVQVSVAGGWAVDALLGRVTRVHADLDLAVDAGSIERATAVLESMGLAIIEDERPGRLALAGADRSVDLHPVVWDAGGTGRQTSREGVVFVYPPGSTDAVGRIDGRTVRCLTPELLVTFHLGYEPRAVDRQDMAALADAFDLDLPGPYGTDKTE
jgi:lincosamide nucleotidyltransferase A/C/D/E